MSERPPMNRQERRKAKRAQDHAAARARGQVTPDELEKGGYYVISSRGSYPTYRIISVGPKWITWEKNDRIGGGWSRSKVLKSGWNGPYFFAVDAPA